MAVKKLGDSTWAIVEDEETSSSSVAVR
jgi:hypothetical protein